MQEALVDLQMTYNNTVLLQRTIKPPFICANLVYFANSIKQSGHFNASKFSQRKLTNLNRTRVTHIGWIILAIKGFKNVIVY